MTVPTTATAPTSTSLSPGVRRFSEARLVPDTLTMAWRSLITMMRNPGEFYDILIQPVMFTSCSASSSAAPSPATSRPTCPRSSRGSSS